MIFHSLTYLVFLVIVLATYWSLPRRGQNLFLVIASYVFYGWHTPWLVLLLWARQLLTTDARAEWSAGRIGAAPFFSRASRQHPLLATFKYANSHSIIWMRC
jgi:hypothetical protein